MVIIQIEILLQFELNKIGHKTDPDESAKYPHLIDAVHIPITNSIEIIARILHSPYFSIKANLSRNYGGIDLLMKH